MMTPEERREFRTALVAAKAHLLWTMAGISPGRLSKAEALVLAGDVELLDDGTALVGSGTIANKAYIVSSHACDCVDFSYGSGGWCKHRLAVMLLVNVEQQLAAQTTSKLAAFV